MQNEQLNHLRHSTAHLLAAAILQMYPDTKLTIGPAIEDGFYYDFDFKDPISENDFPKIEGKMRDIVKQWKNFEKIDSDEKDALQRVGDNEYKKELIEEIAKKGEPITFYKSGEFIDLCRGGHVEAPSKDLKFFKLLSVAGAYWRGSEKNKMLTRIYGTAFTTKEELDEYVIKMQEAKKRDHRRLGKELDLFVFSELIGKGLPLFTPKGTILRDKLNEYSQGLRAKIGFQRVTVPHIAKIETYKTSGHFDKFPEKFMVTSQETEDLFMMKPMNCPHHQQIYAGRPHSYRELPIKYMETTMIYRDEKDGELLGLSRVRAATQDDSHIFCTPDQIKDIYRDLIQIVQEFYKRIGMTLRARLSYRDPNNASGYLGEDSLWELAQKILLEAAQEAKLDYFEAPGEAAFYGPKIDFMATDAIGREWQLATPQLDFVQPKRFGLVYTDSEGKEQTPVMIHFALMGSIERFLSVYIEHTMGNFPVWLAPVQVMISKKILSELKENGIRAELDDRAETMQSKVRSATLQKVPYMVIIGDKEVSRDDFVVTVRTREGKDEGLQTVSDFVKTVKRSIET
ncbi:threonine--tRNA ligase [Candidatus Microgenomates bacterium]|nr:threonine--tRNA ligase [Candidatus Microgenomates bacterium]